MTCRGAFRRKSQWNTKSQWIHDTAAQSTAETTHRDTYRPDAIIAIFCFTFYELMHFRCMWITRKMHLVVTIHYSYSMSYFC